MVSDKAKYISSKEHIEKSYKTGNLGESRFQNALELNGINYTKSSKEDNIKGHIDFYVNNRGVDVKGFKDSHSKGFVVIEFKNVQGNAGWCSDESKAEYIAFEMIDYFIMVKNKELLDYCRANVCNEYSDKFDLVGCYKKLYSRKNRSDLMTVLKTKDLFNLNFVLLLRYG